MSTMPNIKDDPPAHAIDVDSDDHDGDEAKDAHTGPDAVPAKVIAPGEPLS